MTRRVFGRRRSWRSRRAGIVLAVAATTFAGVGLCLWWLLRRAVPQFGWRGTEQAGWIADIASAVLSLLSAFAAVATMRTKVQREQVPRPSRGLVEVGRVPQPAAWFQDRRARVDLARAAGAGRTAVLAQVLSGMGGVGKTQLAAQFARGLASSGELDVLVWVTAVGQDAIIAGYADTARALHLADADTAPQTAAERLTGWLERTDQRWLIVLDNLDTPADATGWWPPANPNGRTVVTTRRRDAILHTDGRTMVYVDLFTTDEAVAYLSHAIGTMDRPENLARLAGDLGYLPLALAQAAAFIRDRGIDCVTYRRRLTDHRERLAHLTPSHDALPDEHRATMAATWVLSIEAADDSQPRHLARPLLEIAALLDPNGIPAVLFTTRAVCSHLATTTTATEEASPITAEPDDGRAVTDALHNLHRLNLITHDQNAGSIRIHALIQRAIRDQLAPDRLAVLARTAADALSTIWPPIERDPAYAQTLRTNTAVLRHNTADNLLTLRIHKVLFTAASSLGEAGLVQPAVAAFEQLVTDCLRVLGPDHPHTLNARANLAYWRGVAGNPAGAATAFEQLVTDYVRVLGSDHPHTLTTRANLARWRGAVGEPAGAATAYEQLVTDYVRVLGPDHPHTLNARANLAYWRGVIGDPALAATADEQLRTAVLWILGPDQPDAVATHSNPAFWRGQTNQIDQHGD